MIYTIIGIVAMAYMADFLRRCRRGFRNMEEDWGDY